MFDMSYMSDISSLVILSLILFSIGLYGYVSNKESIFIIIIALELILIAITLIFVSLNLNLLFSSGLIGIITIIIIAGTESLIGLGILVKYYKC